MSRRWIVGGRYGYYAIDEYEVPDGTPLQASEEKADWKQLRVTHAGMTKKLATSVAQSLNSAYWSGVQDEKDSNLKRMGTR